MLPSSDVLYGPYSHRAEWLARRFDAVCGKGHSPPDVDCGCGVYAHLTEADVVERVRGYRRMHRMVLRRQLPGVLVLGRVALADAVLYTTHMGDREYLAASAQLIELYVEDDPAAAGLAGRLADRYGVSVNTPLSLR